MDIDYRHGPLVKLAAVSSHGYVDAVTELPVLPVFVHLPKTGGSTMMSMIHQDAQAQHLHARFYGNPPAYWDLLKHADDPQTQYLAGHVSIEQLQDIAWEDPRARSFVPFTMLRDPRARFISHWHWANNYALEQLTLQQYAKRALPNTMFHMLAPRWLELSYNGVDGINHEPFQPLDSEQLQQLREFLEQRVVIGLTERFDESLVLLQAAGLVHNMSYGHHKVNLDRNYAHNITADEEKLIDSMTLLDQQLYHIAQEIFDERLAQLDPVVLLKSLDHIKQAKQQHPSVTASKCVDDDPAYGRYTCDGNFAATTKKHAKAHHKRLESGVQIDLLNLLIGRFYRYY
eukprot:TRINITY_DN2499_c0_g1_i1.p1 TRINITY_DN2499_c0_g1~~TRINITY_DN2499_c0_g1_i1.p1  ORF type:complete len:344 (+),score=74.50 TRINITY_DN2499_c0_g1_i1:971-2002(+)